MKVGDKVPADLRIVQLSSSSLRVEQSQLTGESQSVAKDSKALLEDCVIQGKAPQLAWRRGFI